MKKHFSKNIRGFTLIELLVVIAIIAILTGIVVSSLTGSKSKARDAKRISDIGNIQLSLELYFDRCKQYPSALSTGIANGCPSGVTLGSFISVVPTDPTSGSYSYYVLDPNRDDFALVATLENYNEVLKDDLDGMPINSMDTNECGVSNNGQGSNERIYCAGPK